MKELDAKVKVAVVLGALLSWPVFRGWSAGTIGTNAALLRTAIAMGLAYGGIAVVTSVITGYLPKPEPEPEGVAELEGVEDAVLVEGAAVDAIEAPAEG